LPATAVTMLAKPKSQSVVASLPEGITLSCHSGFWAEERHDRINTSSTYRYIQTGAIIVRAFMPGSSRLQRKSGISK
jgi:hypothetical protein